MDYSQSLNTVVDAGTGNRMHLEAQATPSVVSDKDLNSIIWSLMEVVKAGGQVGAQFDPTVPATYQKLLTALRSAGVFQTAPQFDNTTKVATTAWAKVRGMQGSGISVVTVTGALTAVNAGGTVAVNAAGATTQTLPAAAALPSGGRIELMNINTGLATVSRAGADALTVNNTTVTSLALGPGDTLTLVSNGVNGWYAAGGTAQLKYAATFAGVVAGNGYLPVPGGLIEQWGSVTTNASGLATITYPIAFPTAVYSGSVSVASSGIYYDVDFDNDLGSSLTGVPVRLNAAVVQKVFYRVIGK